MRYTRAAFAVGVAVGFIAGSRAGREQYDRIVKYSGKAVKSPPVQAAGRAISQKATDLAKSAAAHGPKAASGAARKARDRVVKVNVPRTPKGMPKVPGMRGGKGGWRSGSANPDAPPVVTQPSVNGDRNESMHKE
jgi:hypothetical protein